jgi:nucleoside-diphosphate-sugar epimerase
MKTIAVFGGSGFLGRECVFQALKRNYNVVVLARNPSKVLIPPGSGGADAEKPFNDPRLKIITGDVTDQASVDKVFESSDDISGVIVALGGKTKLVGPTMLTDGTRCIINSMRAKNVKRISLITSIGVGDSEKQAPLHFKALMYTVMRSIMADKNNQEKLFTDVNGPGRDLEYTIVRPGGLGNGPPTGVVNVIDGKAGSIQRADVASFLLGAVTEANFPYLRQTPCVSSVGGTGWRKEPEKGFDDVKTAD